MSSPESRGPADPGGSVESESHGRLPALLTGLLLLLAASSSPFVAVGGGIGAVGAVILQRRRGRLGAASIVAGAAVGGVVAAFLEGTELRPPGTTGAAAAVMLRHTLLAGTVFGGALVGGGVVLLARGLLPGFGEGDGSTADGHPALARVREMGGRALRPFRLVAILFALAYAPVLASQLRGGAAEARIEMAEELRRIGYHQESHHRAHGRFAPDVRALREYVPIMEGRVEVASAGATEWRATVRHRLLTTACSAEGRVSADGIPLEPTRPECEESRRWLPPGRGPEATAAAPAGASRPEAGR